MTVANELNRRKLIESIGGLAYLISLDDGLPRIFNLDSYARMVSESALRRRFMIAANAAIDAVGSSDADAATVARAIAQLSEVETSSAKGEALMLDIAGIVEQHGGLDGFFNAGNNGKTIAVPFEKLQTVLAGGFRPGQLVTIGARPGWEKAHLRYSLPCTRRRTATQRSSIPSKCLRLNCSTGP